MNKHRSKPITPSATPADFISFGCSQTARTHERRQQYLAVAPHGLPLLYSASQMQLYTYISCIIHIGIAVYSVAESTYEEQDDLFRPDVFRFAFCTPRCSYNVAPAVIIDRAQDNLDWIVLWVIGDRRIAILLCVRRWSDKGFGRSSVCSQE